MFGPVCDSAIHHNGDESHSGGYGQWADKAGQPTDDPCETQSHVHDGDHS